MTSARPISTIVVLVALSTLLALAPSCAGAGIDTSLDEDAGSSSEDGGAEVDEDSGVTTCEGCDLDFADASEGCSTATCPNGCCSTQGACLEGRSDNLCGTAGGVCLRCDVNEAETCVDGACVGPCGACEPGEVQGCGACGEQTCGEDCAWGACGGEGECAPDSTTSCGACGVQTCDAECEWGTCDTSGEACQPGQTRSCGACGDGVQECTDGCTWGSCKDTADNGCGGCNSLPHQPGSACCNGAQWVCDGTDAVRCDGGRCLVGQCHSQCHNCETGNCGDYSCNGSCSACVDCWGNCDGGSGVCVADAWCTSCAPCLSCQ